MRELHLVSIILLAISSSLDNFGVGVSYGLRSVCIPISINLLIASFNSAGTLLSMLFGRVVSSFMEPETAGHLGSALLIGIGLWITAMAFRKRGVGISYTQPMTGNEDAVKGTFSSRIFSVFKDPFAAGIFCAGRVTLREGIVLAAALTFSNISTGVGAGMIGFSPVLTTAAIFICSVLAISGGMKIGQCSGALMIRTISGTAAGMLLVFIGLYETFG